METGTTIDVFVCAANLTRRLRAGGCSGPPLAGGRARHLQQFSPTGDESGIRYHSARFRPT